MVVLVLGGRVGLVVVVDHAWYGDVGPDRGPIPCCGPRLGRSVRARVGKVGNREVLRDELEIGQLRFLFHPRRIGFARTPGEAKHKKERVGSHFLVPYITDGKGRKQGKKRFSGRRKSVKTKWYSRRATTED